MKKSLIKKILKTAGHRGKLDALKRLYPKGTDWRTVRDGDDCTILHRASRGGALETVKFALEELHIPISARSRMYKTAIHEASACGHHSVVRYLLSKKACIESYKLNEWTPLMYAANSGCLEVCKELIASKADIRAVNKEKATPLMLASRNGHIEVVQLLLERKANPNTATVTGRTALHVAIKGGHDVTVSALVEHKGDLSVRDGAGATIWHEMVSHGQVAMLARFLDQLGRTHWPDVLRPDRVGQGLVHCAANNAEHGAATIERIRKHACARDPVSHAQLFASVDKVGATPLHLACAAGNAKVVALLARVAPETLNASMPPHGRTGLHLAAEWGHVRCVRALLAGGADASKKDARGNRPRDVFAGADADFESLFGPRTESEIAEKIISQTL